MRSIEVRELKEQTNQILQEVCEQRAEFVVLRRGRAVARIVPIDVPSRVVSQAEVEAWLAELDELGARFAQLAPEPTTTEELIKDMRRDL